MKNPFQGKTYLTVPAQREARQQGTAMNVHCQALSGTATLPDCHSAASALLALSYLLYSLWSKGVIIEARHGQDCQWEGQGRANQNSNHALVGTRMEIRMLSGSAEGCWLACHSERHWM